MASCSAGGGRLGLFPIGFCFMKSPRLNRHIVLLSQGNRPLCFLGEPRLREPPRRGQSIVPHESAKTLARDRARHA
jgi:hypothetical protein